MGRKSRRRGLSLYYYGEEFIMTQSRQELLDKYPLHMYPNRKWETLQEKEKGIRILLDIHDIFMEANLSFWPFWGTLLGLYRNHDLIDWDGDTDIAILGEDWDKLISLESKFIQKGYDEFGLGGTDLVTIYKDGEHCDIYVFKEGFYGQREYGVFKIDGRIFYGSETVFWKDRYWSLIKNPVDVLKYIYGDDWMIPKKEFEYAYEKREKYI